MTARCECQYKTRPIDPVKPGHLAPMFIFLDRGVGMCAPTRSPLAACARMCPPRETACLSVGRILVGGAASPPLGGRGTRGGGVPVEALAEAVALAGEGEDGAAVDEPVEQRGGELLLAEDLGPAGEVQVGGDRHPGPLVAVGEELEEQLGGGLGEGQVAELVDQHQVEAAQLGQQPGQAQLAVGELQLGGQGGGGAEEHPVAAQAERPAQADEQVGLAQPAGADQQQVLLRS